MARRYAMEGRTAAMQRTRESILDAAVELFGPAWFDEITLADIAKRAGVSQQTVVNHFGTKIDLYLTGLSERYVPEVLAVRGNAVPGDVASVVDAAVRDYEETGDGTIRTLSLAARTPELMQVVEGGRESHHAWVAHAFAPQLARRRGRNRERLARLLAAVLDVRMWHQLRREEGLDAGGDPGAPRAAGRALLADEARIDARWLVGDGPLARGLLDGRLGGRLGSAMGEQHRDLRTPARRGVDRDCTAVLGDDRVHDAEPEAGALDRLLGRGASTGRTG